MDFTQVVMLALGSACTILGWFARGLYSTIKPLRKYLSARVVSTELGQ